jgi:hypothetical protein
MTLSDIITSLQKLSPLVGDAELVLQAVEGGAETVIHSLSVDLGTGGDATGNRVTVKHGAPPPAPAPEPTAEAAPPADPAAA